MIERLANVIYWVGCIVLLACSGMVVSLLLDEGWSDDLVLLWLFMGVLPWALAYSIRYILSGAKSLKPWG